MFVAMERCEQSVLSAADYANFSIALAQNHRYVAGKEADCQNKYCMNSISVNEVRGPV